MARTKATAKKVSESSKGKSTKEYASSKKGQKRPEGVTKRKSKPGTVALREIRKLQKSTDLLLKRLPFLRVLKEIMYENNEHISRITGSATLAIQEAAEQHLINLFEDAQHSAIHAKRITVMPKDYHLIQQIRTGERLVVNAPPARKTASAKKPAANNPKKATAQTTKKATKKVTSSSVASKHSSPPPTSSSEEESSSDEEEGQGTMEEESEDSSPPDARMMSNIVNFNVPMLEYAEDEKMGQWKRWHDEISNWRGDPELPGHWEQFERPISAVNLLTREFWESSIDRMVRYNYKGIDRLTKFVKNYNPFFVLLVMPICLQWESNRAANAPFDEPDFKLFWRSLAKQIYESMTQGVTETEIQCLMTFVELCVKLDVMKVLSYFSNVVKSGVMHQRQLKQWYRKMFENVNAEAWLLSMKFPADKISD